MDKNDLLLRALEASKVLTECLSSLIEGEVDLTDVTDIRVFENSDAEASVALEEARQAVQSSHVDSDQFLTPDTEIVQPSFSVPRSAVPAGVVTKSAVEDMVKPVDSEDHSFVFVDGQKYRLTKRLNKTQCLGEKFADDGKVSTLSCLVLSEKNVDESSLAVFKGFQK